MRIMVAVAVLVLATAGPAIAAPTYLSCMLRGDGAGAGMAIQLTLDEEAQTAIIEIPANGVLDRVPAAFGRQAVTFRNGPSRNPFLFELSRIDLTIRRTMSLSAAVGVDTGICVVSPVPKRVF